MAPSLTEERRQQAAYWHEQTCSSIGTITDTVDNIANRMEENVAAGKKEISVESMMLDSQAALLDAAERPEILDLLPPFKGKPVVELGSGIGRFTGNLADEATHVTTVDFMENLVSKNKEVNRYRENVKFLCADVTNPAVDFEQESMHLVFSNWLFMYLSDKEVEGLGLRILNWVKPEGYFFLRESCFHQSGDHKRKSNPTHYRNPSFYTQIFKSLKICDKNGKFWRFEIEKFCCVKAYVQIKQSQNQVCWLWKKVPVEEKFDFLDDGQYSIKGILKYERIFGEGFVSTGGIDTTRSLLEKLNLKNGEKLLDIGSGLGGGDLYISQNFGVHVTGIDLSVNMISLSVERAIGSMCMVEYEFADCTKVAYKENTFDVIYSRDTILHIHDKLSLFRNVLKWMKPNGRLLITDYCCGKQEDFSEEFKSYVEKRGYDLHQVHDYGKILEKAGFVDVVAEDKTDLFVEILTNELRRTEKVKDKFIADFSEGGYNEIIEGWKAKLERCQKGEQKWGLFIARKP